MKKIRFVLAGLVLLYSFEFVAAQRELAHDEVLQILRVLTDHPRDTWIPDGVIQATHLEYKASDGLIMESTVTVKYDGNRFYWEINMDSCSTEEEIREKSSREKIDRNRNARRVFVWDGQKYTMYFKSGNHAIVTEDTSDMPVSVNGPLTAGLVPWGHGVYTYEQLSVAQLSAVEVEEDGRKKVRLTISIPGKPQMTFVLDADKNYAVLSSTLRNAGYSLTVKTCSGYRLISGRWAPDTIEIEKYDNSRQSPELLSYDNWQITSISTDISEPVPFRVGFKSGSLVEHFTKVSERPLSYYFSSEADTESLRRERVRIAAADKSEIQNCATAAIQYVISRFGKEVTRQQLAGLVNEIDKTTSLYRMKQFVSATGLHSLAVRTNVRTLKDLTNCSVILHLPSENHFVVLDHIDEQNVWLIDLDRNKFYFPVKIDMFGQDWSGGTALLISRDPVIIRDGITEIRDYDLRRIVGSDSLGTYSCTQLIQEYRVEHCSEMYMGLCSGRYRKYFTRYGCELNENAGGCSGSGIVGNRYSYCVEDFANPGHCGMTGEFYSQYIRACVQ